MHEQILIFSVEEKELKSRLRKALMPLHVRVRAVGAEECTKTIGEIAGLSPVGEGGASDTGAESQSLSDPMMVFAGFSSAGLDAVLRSLRKNSVNIPYKAVLTESNAAWTPHALLEELKKEHSMTHGR